MHVRFSLCYLNGVAKKEDSDCSQSGKGCISLMWISSRYSVRKIFFHNPNNLLIPMNTQGCALYMKLRSIPHFKGLNKGCLLYMGAFNRRDIIQICHPSVGILVEFSRGRRKTIGKTILPLGDIPSGYPHWHGIFV